MALFGAQGNLAQRTEMVKHQTDDFNHLVFEHMGKIDIPVMFSAVDGNLNYAWLWAYADLKGKVLFKSCREISLEANVDGPANLLRFTKHSFEHAADRPRTWFFDDLGVESGVNYFGNHMMCLVLK